MHSDPRRVADVGVGYVRPLLSRPVYSRIVRVYISRGCRMAKAQPVVRKNMRLRQDLLDQAKKILGTRTETETVEQALELVAFRKEVSEGIRRIAGSRSMRDIYAEEA
jgi:hypothetical protein